MSKFKNAVNNFTKNTGLNGYDVAGICIGVAMLAGQIASLVCNHKSTEIKAKQYQEMFKIPTKTEN